MHIFYGLVGVVLAILMIKYRKQVIDFTGPWGWAESYIGIGQSYNAVVLMAVIMFFLSLGLMTGSLDSILGSTVGRILPSG